MLVKISTLIKDQHFRFIISIIFSIKNIRVEIRGEKVRRVRKRKKEEIEKRREQGREGRREEEEEANRHL